MPTPVLLAEAVSRRYRNGRGVGPVSLRAEGGEVLALVGPNGSGKTTLVRCLGTRSPHQSGELLWFGKPDPRRARGRLGVVFDATAHVDELSGEENLQFFARVRGGASTQPLLRDAELTEVAGEPISSYSYGMRRRLLLAEALRGDPELLILDEPTLGLDVVGRRWLADTLAERRRRGLVAVVSTNDTEFVEAVATRVGFLIDGLLVQDAPLHQLLASVGGLREIHLSCRAGVDADLLRRVAGVERVAEVEGGFTVLATRRDGLLADVLACIGELDRKLVDLSVREPGLADCFLRLTGRSLDG